MEGEYVKINRKTFSESMPSNLKKAFITIILAAPALTEDAKNFTCDMIQNYETIGEYARSEVLDVIDELHLFKYGNKLDGLKSPDNIKPNDTDLQIV